MIELTAQQQRALDAGGWPPIVLNPRTRETFVLISAEMFERVCAVLEAEDGIPDIEEMYPLVNEVLDASENSSRGTA